MVEDGIFIGFVEFWRVIFFFNKKYNVFFFLILMIYCLVMEFMLMDYNIKLVYMNVFWDLFIRFGMIRN